MALFNPNATEDGQMTFPAPSKVAETPLETLRTAGLSQRKAEYIQGLAEKFASGDLTTEFLMKAPYEEVFEKLVAVRGLGAWSVEMFACFGLKRLDVFSTGDLGVQLVASSPWLIPFFTPEYGMKGIMPRAKAMEEALT